MMRFSIGNRGRGRGFLLAPVVLWASLFPRVGTCVAEAGDASSPPGNASRYERTVYSLQDSPAELRSAFAEVALAELISIYLAEADLARSQAAESGRSRKLLRWSRAVEQYADDLLLVLEDVQQGFPASILPRPAGSATLIVADRRVVLTHPRLNQQAGYQQRVLSDFCSREDCDSLTADTSDGDAIPVSASLVAPAWTFTGEGPVCAHRGLSISFQSGGKLGQQRSACHQLFQELSLLGTEFAWQRRHGVEVEWGRVSIQPTPHQPEHIVTLNAGGDSILVSVPLLYSSPELFTDVKPWLQARYEGRPPDAMRLEADNYWGMNGL